MRGLGKKRAAPLPTEFLDHLLAEVQSWPEVVRTEREGDVLWVEMESPEHPTYRFQYRIDLKGLPDEGASWEWDQAGRDSRRHYSRCVKETLLYKRANGSWSGGGESPLCYGNVPFDPADPARLLWDLRRWFRATRRLR